MTKYFDFRDALETMWDGGKVVSSRGDVYWYNSGVFYKSPASNPKITQVVIKFYSDIMLESSKWSLYETTDK